MEWNESYATGVPQLDQQHQTLFKAVAALADAVDSPDGAAEYARLLVFLVHYCKDHFSIEERCMAQHRCPTAATNKAQHAGLIEMLGEHQRYFAANGYDQRDAQLLVTTLQHWLRSHIGRVDLELRRCVTNHAS
ncbi:MAG: bacteriohemerythrin [Gemmatimonadetes bacterium]|nr:bacteriohemerythrin [Gemmatimonadota bacterium]